MPDANDRLQETREVLAGFIDDFESLVIASVDEAGQPAASYAPFVRDDAGHFYIFVSLLAEHTRNLLGQPRASILFIEPEMQTRQIFARRRASFRCRVEPIARDSDEAEVPLARLRERFGEIMDLLGGLGDFRLLRLVPEEGRFVIGFGQAYRLTGPHLAELEPIGPREDGG
ncbi:MAG TPA: HugZ family protein [Thioalkalivibrio sp.]|nr:HugZ family protein [Thioalkalivibrio sp.]